MNYYSKIGIELGGITESLNDKADRDLRNVDTISGADTVIEYQIPTVENNYTWYRLYKSGWVEQGGIYNNGSVSRDLTATIDLRITMANDNYTAIITSARNTGNPTSRSGYSTIYTKSTTQLGIGYYGVGTSDTMQYISWEVKGMAA